MKKTTRLLIVNILFLSWLMVQDNFIRKLAFKFNLATFSALISTLEELVSTSGFCYATDP